MDKTKKIVVSAAIVVLFVASISGTVLYYQGLLGDRDSRISELESQVTDQSGEITDFQSQVADLQKQIENQTWGRIIRISNVTSDKEWHNLSGLSLAFFFDITIENIVDEEASGVQVTVQRLNSQHSVASGYYQLYNFGTIKPGETSHVRLDIAFELTKYKEYQTSNYLVVLSANGSKVLDQYSL